MHDRTQNFKSSVLLLLLAHHFDIRFESCSQVRQELEYEKRPDRDQPNLLTDTAFLGGDFIGSDQETNARTYDFGRVPYGFVLEASRRTPKETMPPSQVTSWLHFRVLALRIFSESQIRDTGARVIISKSTYASLLAIQSSRSIHPFRSAPASTEHHRPETTPPILLEIHFHPLQLLRRASHRRVAGAVPAA